MKFIETVQKSVYGPEFYKKLLQEKFSFSFQYYYSLAIALSLALTVLLSFRVVPSFASFLRSLGPMVSDYFPEELEITIRDGKAATNVQEPYHMLFPEALRSKGGDDPSGDLRYFLVIDTKREFNVREFENEETLILLTEREVAFRDDARQIRIQSLRDAPNILVNRTIITSFLDAALPFLRLLVPVIIFGIFIGFLFSFTFLLFYFLFAALLLWLLLKARKVRVPYKKAYQIALHAATLGFLLEFFLSMLAPPFHAPFFFTVLLLVVALMNFKSEEETPSIPATSLPSA